MNERACADLLAQNDGYLLVTHRNPDGDTLGSSAALCRGLRALGKTAFVLENKQITPKYQDLVQGLTTDRVGGLLPVFVDVAAPDMASDDAKTLGLCPWLVIDHHLGDRYGDVPRCADTGAAAVGEIVFRLLGLLGAAPDEKIARALYVAISTDTGCFRFGNTTAETHRIAGELLKYPIGLEELNRQLFEIKTPACLSLQQRVLADIRYFAEGRGALIAISARDRRELAVTEDDMDEISSLPRTVEGVDVGVTLKELPDEEGTWKVSLRTTPAADAAAICACFGGGGHARAAGCTLHGDLQDVAQAVCDACARELEKASK